MCWNMLEQLEHVGALERWSRETRPAGTILKFFLFSLSFTKDSLRINLDVFHVMAAYEAFVVRHERRACRFHGEWKKST